MWYLAFAICVTCNCTKMYACSGHYAIGFPGPMRSLNTLNSIDNNQSIVWDNGVYSLIIKIRFYVIASNGNIGNILIRPIFQYTHWTYTYPIYVHSAEQYINRVFHKLDEIGNNANIGIRGFTTQKQKFQ